LSDCEEMMVQYSIEWGADIKFILEELDPQHGKSTPEAKDQKEKVADRNEHYHDFKDKKEFREECRVKSNTPEWAKKAFRKIALKTHPDKIGDDKNSKEMEALYTRANDAISKEDYDSLLEICSLLSIENDVDPELELEYSEKRCTSIKSKLGKITESLPWAWGESYDNRTLRRDLLLSILPQYGVEDVSLEMVSDILDKLLER